MKTADIKIAKMSDRELMIEIYKSFSKFSGSGNSIWLTNEEMVKQLGVSRRTLYQWRHERRITFYQVNRSIVYKIDDVIRFLEKYKFSCNEEKGSN